MEREKIQTIAQLIQSLSREEKQLLELELQPNTYFREYLQGNVCISAPILLLENKDRHYRLIRLTDSQYIQLSQHRVSCKSDFAFFWHVLLSRDPEKENLNLAQIYVTLTHLAGASGNYFDSHKGSFFFPFFLEAIKTGRTYNYLVVFRDSKGWLEIPFYYCLESDETKDRYDADRGLSLQERSYLQIYLYGYLMGYFQTAIAPKKHANFYHFIDSNFIIYGYRDGEFFEWEYEDQEEYKEQLRNLRI